MALVERPAESTRTLTLEILEEFEQSLRSEYTRLSGESNPAPPIWDEFLEFCVALGLEKLRELSAEKALNLLEGVLLRSHSASAA